VVGYMFLLVRPQRPIDEGPAAFPERVVVLVEDPPPHRASTERLKLLTGKPTSTIRGALRRAVRPP
jgi:hypothetical protein